MSKFLKYLAILLATISLTTVVGCMGDQVASQVAAKNDSSIKRVTNLYYAYQRSHGWQGPKDEKALRDFVAEHGLPPENFRMMGIDEGHLDSLFISDRDGKPFKIRYGVGGGMGVTDAITFENQGIDGKRYVAFLGPVVEEVDNAKYNELWQHGGAPSGSAGQRMQATAPTAQK
jgi:hypothetical protein